MSGAGRTRPPRAPPTGCPAPAPPPPASASPRRRRPARRTARRGAARAARGPRPWAAAPRAGCAGAAWRPPLQTRQPAHGAAPRPPEGPSPQRARPPCRGARNWKRVGWAGEGGRGATNNLNKWRYGACLTPKLMSCRAFPGRWGKKQGGAAESAGSRHASMASLLWRAASCCMPLRGVDWGLLLCRSAAARRCCRG